MILFPYDNTREVTGKRYQKKKYTFSTTYINIDSWLSEDPSKRIFFRQVAEELLSPSIPLDTVQRFVSFECPLAAKEDGLA